MKKKKVTIVLLPTPEDEWECYMQVLNAQGEAVGFLDCNGHEHTREELPPLSWDLEAQMAIMHRFLYRNKDVKVRIKLQRIHDMRD